MPDRVSAGFNNDDYAFAVKSTRQSKEEMNDV